MKQTSEPTRCTSTEELQQIVTDNRRIASQAKNKMIGGGAVAIAGSFLLHVGGAITVIGIIALTLGTLYAANFWLVRNNSRDAIKKRLGETLIPDLLSEVFDDLQYDHDGRISDEIINHTDMAFPFSFNRIHGSDHIRGTYRGVRVELSDITLEEVFTYETTDDRGNSETKEEVRERFDGQWLICDMQKELSTDLWVFEGGRKRKKLEQIETENETFNARYGIVCASAHDAFYILTPHMMDHIMAMDDRAGGLIYLRFAKEGKVHLALSSGRNHFEVGHQEDLETLRQRFRSEVQYVTDLIDELLSVDTLYQQSEG